MRQIEDDFTIENIGASLLEELARGLYEPATVLREYIQNAVDAHRDYRNKYGDLPDQEILIEFDDDDIRIIDFGIGMELAEVKDVKSIAISSKRNRSSDLTGRKGVGIWSGLNFFSKVHIKTSKKGVPNAYIIEINFAAILKHLNSDQVVNMNIKEVVAPNYAIFETEEASDKHYSIVTLSAPIEVEYRKQLLDPQSVKKVVADICPCRVQPDFIKRQDLLDWYTENDIDQFGIKVNGEEVYKAFPSATDEFIKGEINVDSNVVAKYWLIPHNPANRQNGKFPESKDYLTGVRLIQKGFVLGAANPYSKDTMEGYITIRPQSYLDWYAGEIHILDESLQPTLARNELQSTEKERRFINQLRQFYGDLTTDTREVASLRQTMWKIVKFNTFIQEVVDKGEYTETKKNEAIIDEILDFKFADNIRAAETSAKKANYSYKALKTYKNRLLRDIKREKAEIFDNWSALQGLVINLPDLSDSSNAGKRVKTVNEGTENSASQATPLPNPVVGPSVNTVNTDTPPNSLNTQSQPAPSVQLQPAAISPNVQVITDITSEGFKTVDLNIVMGIVAEVLTEILSNEPERQKKYYNQILEQIKGSGS
ncbi:ATP-binding protein [Deinococcus maricopensis]|uniref:ATP-binding region ATPase domain protein n=1 Tax=Deinococcus maricopensis (strain DSM 21211 / LMG 22137 / NRRL B-23946 / LB-34) TaxID=709986 RepID=E8U3V3_DEIML|nr:ATP-binding protein [Deinococcus maricopensis]ADV68796.1 hypothetical protein Deima_3168 [Deinococcus maricopensis DSM 21211]